jgi:hypothetical protein
MNARRSIAALVVCAGFCGALAATEFIWVLRDDRRTNRTSGFLCRNHAIVKWLE